MKPDTDEIKKLILEFRDIHLPDYNSPMHDEAKAWKTMKEFLYFLRCRDIAEEYKSILLP